MIRGMMAMLKVEGERKKKAEVTIHGWGEDVNTNTKKRWWRERVKGGRSQKTSDRTWVERLGCLTWVLPPSSWWRRWRLWLSLWQWMTDINRLTEQTGRRTPWLLMRMTCNAIKARPSKATGDKASKVKKRGGNANDRSIKLTVLRGFCFHFAGVHKSFICFVGAEALYSCLLTWRWLCCLLPRRGLGNKQKRATEMTDNVVHASYEDTAKKFVYSEKYVYVNYVCLLCSLICRGNHRRVRWDGTGVVGWQI